LETEFDGKKRTGYRVTDFNKAKRNGEVFEDMIKAYGIPCQPYPHCTRELKLEPIQRYAKDFFKSDYQTAIGIRADEVDRVNNKYKEQRLYYPLVSANISKPDVNAFWRDQDFRLNLKGYEGNCDMCWKKSNRKLLTLIAEKPELMNWWLDMEEKYSGYIPPHRDRSNHQGKLNFFRKNLSGLDLLKMSKEDFEKANDDAVNYYKQTSLFGYDLDSSNGCEESCEVY
jgi:hypothetical protein